MTVFDIIVGSLLAFAVYNGIKKGLFVELGTFVAFLIGIYVTIRFSSFVKAYLSEHFHINSKYVGMTAFLLTFVLVVVGIYFLAKTLTKMAKLAHLGWVNQGAGALFSLFKTIMALGIIFNLFQKINTNYVIVKKESIDNSIFYNPVLETAMFVYPSLETLFVEQWNKVKDAK